jgi:hypothetical protein
MPTEGRFSHYRTTGPLPANHQWVPVSKWKLAQLSSSARPTARARICAFAMRQKASTNRIRILRARQDQASAEASQQFEQDPEQNLAPRVNQTTQEEDTEDTTALPPMITLLENLQRQFLSLFLTLSHTDQQALIENYLLHNFAIWRFSAEEDTLNEQQDDRPLAEATHEPFNALMHRLARLATWQPETETDAASESDNFEDIFDNVFGDDELLETPEQQQQMRRFLETSISGLLLYTKT